MSKNIRLAVLALLLLALVGGLGGLPPATAQEETEAPAAASPGDDMEEIEEVIVVTASRTEQALHEVPAAISVLSSQQLEQIPADDFGDYLRNVPGLNVSQLSARDIQITGRGATSSLATSQLVLMDNRTLYLDFFGFVMWDFMPVDAREIKQIEVVRGPGSAVWGANAMSGVINVITKSPRESQGTSLALGAGDFGTLYGSITHAGASEKWGYKLSGSFYEQDPYERPSGIIPGTQGPTSPRGTPYPPFANQGTEQPKVTVRFDYDASLDSTWNFAAGYAGTDGIIHSGIGPFDIASGTTFNFFQVNWTKRAARATFFANLLDGDADNLLTVGTDGRPLTFAFESETYDLSFGDTRVAGEKNIFSYGASARQNEFDLSIAPRGDERQELGIYLQDEILIGDKVRWLIGARWDDIDPIGSVVSPRTSLLFSATPDHTFRVSYNRAFRAPSMINNFLEIGIVNAANIPPIPQLGVPGFQLIFPSLAIGNVDLTEEQLDAVEVGYVGTFGRTTFTASVYRNETTDSTDFFTAAYYSAANPVPGWPLPPFLLDPPFPFANTFPSVFSYRNIGEIIDQGVEISLDVRPNMNWSYFFNYSYQEEPEVTGIEQTQLPNGTLRDAINTPPEHRANFGFAYDQPRFFFNGNANYVDEAFWTDVLDARFWGPTDAFTMVNLGGGVRFSDGKVTLSVTAQNVFDEDVLQHIFGDLIERKITGQLLFRF